MQAIAEVMTRDVQVISPQDSVRLAASLIDGLDVGALPVCDGNRLVGVITGRDIAVRATATGMSPDTTRAEQAMSTDLRWCHEDQEVNAVMQQMSDAQIRRIPVVSRDRHELIGIAALGDLATTHSAMVDRTLDEISTLAQPDRSG